MEQIERIAGLEARVDNLEGWQRTQNGHMGRIEDKVNNIYKIMVGLFGGVIASLILLCVNLIIGR